MMKLTLCFDEHEDFYSFMISLLSNDQLTNIVNVKVTVLSPSMAEPRTADLVTDMMMMVCPG